jgi:hypothetical protein
MAQGIEYFPNFDKVLGVETSTGKLVVNDKLMTFPATDATIARTDAAQTFTGAQTFSGNVTAPNALTATNLGTVTTSATTVAEEHGDGLAHVTKLTFTAFAVGTSDNGAALASGAKFYTLPAGAIVVDGAAIVGSLTGAMTTKTDTPEVGIGTVIGSGVAATLSTTMEDIIDGGAAGLIGGANVAPDVNGTTFAKGMLATSAQGVYIATSGGKSHDLFLNIADTWVAEAAAAITFTGVITLKWRLVS